MWILERRREEPEMKVPDPNVKSLQLRERLQFSLENRTKTLNVVEQFKISGSSMESSISRLGTVSNSFTCVSELPVYYVKWGPPMINPAWSLLIWRP